MTDESHQAITTMRAAFEFIEDLRDRIATLTAQRDAAEKVCEAAERIVRRPYELLQRVADHESEERQMLLDLASALTEWRRTKEDG